MFTGEFIASRTFRDSDGVSRVANELYRFNSSVGAGFLALMLCAAY